MTRVLAAIDSSPCAPAVVGTALSIAELFEGTATGLHVREDGSEPAEQLAREMGIELTVAVGPPMEAIVAAARHPDVVAVVIGARGTHRGPRPAGHAALEVITRVSKPVVVVPPQSAATPIARLLTPLEGTDESSQAIAATLAQAARRDLEIVALHVHRPEAVPPFQDQPHHEHHAWTREFSTRFVAPPRRHITVVQRVGAAADHLVPVARDTHADLIALGWSQDLSPGRAHVVREALANSSIPVLLVRTA